MVSAAQIMLCIVYTQLLMSQYVDPPSTEEPRYAAVVDDLSDTIYSECSWEEQLTALN
jgi:hypothetical protein